MPLTLDQVIDAPANNAAELRARYAQYFGSSPVQSVVSLDATHLKEKVLDLDADRPELILPPWKITILRVDTRGVHNEPIILYTVAVRLDRQGAYDLIHSMGQEYTARATPIHIYAQTKHFTALFGYRASRKQSGIHFTVATHYQTDQDGNQIGEHNTQPAALGQPFAAAIMEAFYNDASKVKDFVSSMSGLQVNTAAFAFGLANCKNIIVRDNPNKIQRRRLEKQDGIRYRELVIDSTSPVYRRSGSARSQSTQTMSKHICRGHFKDYREKGLFGQHKGVYWWDQQARGSGPGRVVKSYSVK